jgi:hypothetical protein
MTTPVSQESIDESPPAFAEEGYRRRLASSHITQSRSPRVRIFFGLSTTFHLVALVALWWLWTGKSERPKAIAARESAPQVRLAERKLEVVRINLGDSISVSESLSIEAITQQLAKIRAESKATPSAASAPAKN